MAYETKVVDSASLSKKGGYSGGKPGSSMRPPVKVPASTAGRPPASDDKKK